MKEKSVTLPSKAVLKIQSAPWEEAHALYKAVMGVVSKISFNTGGDSMINVLAKVTISPEIETALWVCMGRALYSGQKINKDLFENDEAREDFLLIQKEVLAFNMAPFLKSLSSVLSQASGLKNLITPE